MSPRTLANRTASSAAPQPGTPRPAAVRPADPAPATITPDLAAVLHDARPHPQLARDAPGRAPTDGGARLGRAAAAIAADLARRPNADPGLEGLHASYLLPAGTRARVHRSAPDGVLLLAPCDAPRAVAVAGPGVYVVVEASS